MSKKNWQLQLRGDRHSDRGDTTYHWLDIVTVSNSGKYGPGSKAQAVASLREMREMHGPAAVYRIVKVAQV